MSFDRRQVSQHQFNLKIKPNNKYRQIYSELEVNSYATTQFRAKTNSNRILNKFINALDDEAIDKIEIFLKKNPELVNTVCDTRGNTPLHIATQKEHNELIELLLTYKADCTQENIDGQTPLQLAKEILSNKLSNENENENCNWNFNLEDDDSLPNPNTIDINTAIETLQNAMGIKHVSQQEETANPEKEEELDQLTTAFSRTTFGIGMS